MAAIYDQASAPALQAGGFGTRREIFPDPFADYSSQVMPTGIRQAIRWCQHIVTSNNTYGQALRRVASYFITDVEINDDNADTQERKKYTEYLDESLGIKRETLTALLDYLIYGNVFISVMMPFRRFLSCPHGCGETPLSKVFNTDSMHFQWINCEFHASCPKCNYSGPFKHIDRKSENDDDVFIRRWNPLDIEIIPDVITNRCTYIWDISAEERKAIKDGKSLLVLENTPWEVIQVVKAGDKLCFDKDMLLHLKEPAPAGYRMNGWGASRVLTNFRQAWIVQVMRRFNEAIALDFLNPFRVVTPAPQTGSDIATDPVIGQDLSVFRANVMNMMREHRMDPATIHICPQPLQYQTLGGDAEQFAPKELLDQADDCLLNGIGVPVEMYKGTMSVQAAQIGIRLFESQWNSLPQARDQILRFIMKRLSTLLSWERLKARWRPVTLIDDADKMAAKLQLMLAKQLSQTTGLASIGEEFEQQNRQMLDEQKIVATLTAEAQKEMEAEQAIDTLLAGTSADASAGGDGSGGAAASFGAGQPTQPNQPTTPEELDQKAQQIAQSYMAMPDSQRRSAMLQLRQKDKVLGPLVSDAVERLTQQQRLQGGEMLKQQQQQAGAKTAGLVSLYGRRRVLT